MSSAISYNLSADRKAQMEWLQWRALAVGVVALIACIIGAFFSPEQFFRAYLVAYLYFLGIAHGCFVLLMIYYLTGGAWGFLIRRFLEAGMRTLVLMAVLFIPIGCGFAYLYDWAQPEVVATSKALQLKTVYLNVPFVWGRAVFYFVLWVGIALLLSRWSRQQDRTGDPRLAKRMTTLSGPGLAIFGITITFASVDWVMSLQTAFRSTIFGPLFASGEILTGIACAVLVLGVLVARSPLRRMLSIKALNDLGNLVFTFLIIFAYMTFFQFMLIWIANLPYDVIWYLPRTSGPWQFIVVLLVLFHFAIPFFLLLSRDIKREPRALAALGGVLLFMHLIYLFYMVLPAFPNTTLVDHWMDFLTPLGVGGLWLAFFLWNLQRAPILPLHDANQRAALHYRAEDEERIAEEEEIHHHA